MITKIPRGVEAVKALLRLPESCRLLGVADEEEEPGVITFLVEDATGEAPDEAVILYDTVKLADGRSFLDFRRFGYTREALERMLHQQGI